MRVPSVSFTASTLRFKELSFTADTNLSDQVRHALERTFAGKEYPDPQAAADSVFSDEGFACHLARFRVSKSEDELEAHFQFTGKGTYRDACFLLSNLRREGLSDIEIEMKFRNDHTTQIARATVEEVCAQLIHRTDLVNEITRTRRKTCRC